MPWNVYYLPKPRGERWLCNPTRKRRAPRCSALAGTNIKWQLLRTIRPDERYEEQKKTRRSRTCLEWQPNARCIYLGRYPWACSKVLCTHLGHGGPKNESHCMIKFCISFVSQHHGDSGSIWAELNSSSFYCSDRVKVGYQLSVSRNHSYHSKIGLMA